MAVAQPFLRRGRPSMSGSSSDDIARALNDYPPAGEETWELLVFRPPIWTAAGGGVDYPDAGLTSPAAALPTCELNGLRRPLVVVFASLASSHEEGRARNSSASCHVFRVARMNELPSKTSDESLVAVGARNVARDLKKTLLAASTIGKSPRAPVRVFVDTSLRNLGAEGSSAVEDHRLPGFIEAMTDRGEVAPPVAVDDGVTTSSAYDVGPKWFTNDLLEWLITDCARGGDIALTDLSRPAMLSPASADERLARATLIEQMHALFASDDIGSRDHPRLPPGVLSLPIVLKESGQFTSMLIAGDARRGYDARVAAAAASVGERAVADEANAELEAALSRGIPVTGLRLHKDIGDTAFQHNAVASGTFEHYAQTLHPDGELVVEFLSITAQLKPRVGAWSRAGLVAPGFPLDDVSVLKSFRASGEGPRCSIAVYYQVPVPPSADQSTTKADDGLSQAEKKKKSVARRLAAVIPDFETFRRSSPTVEMLKAALDAIRTLLMLPRVTTPSAVDGNPSNVLATDGLPTASQLIAELRCGKAGGTVVGPCKWCSRLRSSNQRCAGCKITFYCSREHQLLHWKEGGHKVACGVIKEEGKALAERFGFVDVTVAAEAGTATASGVGVGGSGASKDVFHGGGATREASDAFVVQTAATAAAADTSDRGGTSDRSVFEMHIVDLSDEGESALGEEAWYTPSGGAVGQFVTWWLTSPDAEPLRNRFRQLRLLVSSLNVAASLHNCVFALTAPAATADAGGVPVAVSPISVTDVPGDVWRDGAGRRQPDGNGPSSTREALEVRVRFWQGKYHTVPVPLSVDPRNQANAATSADAVVVLHVKPDGVSFFDAFTRPIAAELLRRAGTRSFSATFGCPTRRACRAVTATLDDVARHCEGPAESHASPAARAFTSFSDRATEIELPVAHCGPAVWSAHGGGAAAMTAPVLPGVTNAYVLRIAS